MSHSVWRNLLSGVALALAVTSPHAAQRTFVASSGNDVNPCSLTAPCRTFAAAMALTSDNGEIVVLDSAGYGGVTITTSVSILAPEGVYAGISVFAGQNGIAINAPASRVTLRGLAINGQGGNDGLVVSQAGDVFVERCVVSNMGNDLAHVGIRVAAPGARVFIHDSAVRGGAGSGILVSGDATVNIQRSEIQGNASLGIVATAASYRITVADSVVARNGSLGIDLLGTGGTSATTVTRTLIEGNGQSGIQAAVGSGGSHVLSVTQNIIRNNNGNGLNVAAPSGGTISAAVSGNTIVNNAGAGIQGSGAGATVIADRNVVSRNNIGLSRVDPAVFSSLGNNAVADNATDTLGGVSTVLAK